MKRTITTKAAPRQLYRVVHDCQLGKPLGHVKTNAVVELLEGRTDSKHLEPIGDFVQRGDPNVKAKFQLVEAAY